MSSGSGRPSSLRHREGVGGSGGRLKCSVRDAAGERVSEKAILSRPPASGGRGGVGWRLSLRCVAEGRAGPAADLGSRRLGNLGGAPARQGVWKTPRRRRPADDAWTSDQARAPAEFKHITKRRKRN